jgi:hypothetical protein
MRVPASGACHVASTTYRRQANRFLEKRVRDIIPADVIYPSCLRSNGGLVDSIGCINFGRVDYWILHAAMFNSIALSASCDQKAGRERRHAPAAAMQERFCREGMNKSCWNVFFNRL